MLQAIDVKISAKMARLEFHECTPHYIRTVCRASCCQSTKDKSGVMISVLPEEIPTLEKLGAIVIKGFLQPRPGQRRCPFKSPGHLCHLHFTPDKPFGCIASPFTINKNRTLIVRNRYKLLKCYKDGPKLPAYVVFQASLDMLFGERESIKLCKHLDRGGGDITVPMPRDHYLKLIYNDETKSKQERLF